MLKRLEAKKIRYQRKYARMARANDKKAGTNKRVRTNGEKKLTLKLAVYSEKTANIRHYNSHCISKEIAENTPLCAVFEDLKLNNMVRRPKAKLCPETNKWLRNGASAKSGLNKAILSANLGQIRQYTDYKLAAQGKLMIRVKPHHSSQECSVCGYTHKDNRPTQALFKCGQCQQEMNTDDNASIVLKKRGLKHIRSEAFSKEKTVRKISARKNTKAHELAPSGCGEDIRLASQATFYDALNSLSTISSSNGLSEARRL